MALPGHLHDPERGNRQDVILRLIAGHFPLHAVVNGVAVLLRLHVDEVEDDQAADIPQAHLPGDFRRRLQIDLKDEVFAVFALIFVGAGVHVDRDERLRLFDDDLPATGQGDAAHKGLLNLTFDIEALEYRDVFGESGYLRFGARGDLRDLVDDVVVVLFFVDHHAVDVFRQEVAHGAPDDVRLDVEAGGFFTRLHALLDHLPPFEQDVQVADEVARFLPLAGGADDDPHALRQGQIAENRFQAATFLPVINLSGNPHCAGVRHEHEEPTGQGDIRRGAGPLGADLALGDLNHDFAADRVELRNVFYGHLLGFPLALLLRFVVADHLDRTVIRRRQNVPVVEERVFLFADVDEGSLEAGLHILDPAFEDRSHLAGLPGALDFKFFEDTILK